MDVLSAYVFNMRVKFPISCFRVGLNNEAAGTIIYDTVVSN
jgi:hypothetical protein